jgi:hypothetical protein
VFGEGKRSFLPTAEAFKPDNQCYFGESEASFTHGGDRKAIRGSGGGRPAAGPGSRSRFRQPVARSLRPGCQGLQGCWDRQAVARRGRVRPRRTIQAAAMDRAPGDYLRRKVLSAARVVSWRVGFRGPGDPGSGVGIGERGQAAGDRRQDSGSGDGLRSSGRACAVSSLSSRRPSAACQGHANGLKRPPLPGSRCPPLPGV